MQFDFSNLKAGIRSWAKKAMQEAKNELGYYGNFLLNGTSQESDNSREKG